MPVTRELQACELDASISYTKVGTGRTNVGQSTPVASMKQLQGLGAGVFYNHSTYLNQARFLQYIVYRIFFPIPHLASFVSLFFEHKRNHPDMKLRHFILSDWTARDLTKSTTYAFILFSTLVVYATSPHKDDVQFCEVFLPWWMFFGVLVTEAVQSGFTRSSIETHHAFKRRNLAKFLQRLDEVDLAMEVLLVHDEELDTFVRNRKIYTKFRLPPRLSPSEKSLESLWADWFEPSTFWLYVSKALAAIIFSDSDKMIFNRLLAVSELSVKVPQTEGVLRHLIRVEGLDYPMKIPEDLSTGIRGIRKSVAFDRTPTYFDAAEDATVLPKELAQRILEGLPMENGILQLLQTLLLILQRFLVILIVVTLALVPAIVRVYIEKKDNAWPKDWTTWWVRITYTACGIMILTVKAMGLHNLQTFLMDCLDQFKAQGLMLGSPEEARKAMLPVVRCDDYKSLLVWAEVRALLLSIFHTRKQHMEARLGFAVLSEVGMSSAVVYYILATDWTPGVLSISTLLLMLLFVVNFLPALGIAVLANLRGRRIMDLMSAQEVQFESYASFLEADLINPTASSEHSTAGVVVAAEEARKGAAEQARKGAAMARALTMNLQVNRQNKVFVLGVELTIERVTSGALVACASFMIAFFKNIFSQAFPKVSSALHGRHEL